MGLQRLSEPTRRLYRLVHRAAKKKALEAESGKLAKALGKAFAAQGRALVKGLLPYQDTFVSEASREWERISLGYGMRRLHEALADDLVNGLFEKAAQETEKDFTDPLQEAESKMLQAGAKLILGELGYGLNFRLKNPRAVAYLEQHGGELIKGINEVTREEVRRLLSQASENGWSYSKVTRELTKLYDDFAVATNGTITSRAELIAVTEAGNAFEAGNFIPIQDLMDSGVGMEKQWDSTHEDDVCEECAGNNAEGWIPADEAHQSGDMTPLAHPRCECDEFYQVKGA